MNIKNGNSLRFWTYIWHPIGRMIEVVGDRGRLKLGIDMKVCVAEVLVEKEWRLRHSRYIILQHMTDKVRALQHVNMNDEYRAEFSAFFTWDLVPVTVPPSHGVSSSGLHNESRGMLLSLGWLSRTNFPHMSKCVLDFPHVQGCLSSGESEESRNHLFFAFQYTYTLWLEVIESLL
ncbi:hypothetical protein YC2023_110096 [Brassica napus]